jgi:hypothetical protein
MNLHAVALRPESAAEIALAGLLVHNKFAPAFFVSVNNGSRQ